MGKRTKNIKNVVFICDGKDCRKKGGKELKRAVKSSLKEAGCFSETLITCTGCTGMCKEGPIVGVQPHGTWVTKATPKKVKKAVANAFIDG